MAHRPWRQSAHIGCYCCCCPSPSSSESPSILKSQLGNPGGVRTRGEGQGEERGGRGAGEQGGVDRSTGSLLLLPESSSRARSPSCHPPMLPMGVPPSLSVRLTDDDDDGVASLTRPSVAGVVNPATEGRAYVHEHPAAVVSVACTAAKCGRARNGDDGLCVLMHIEATAPPLPSARANAAYGVWPYGVGVEST